MSHPSSLNASSIVSRSTPTSSQSASPLRTRLSQPHAFAASLNTAPRPPLAKDAECPTHYYQLDLSTLRKTAAVFGSEPKHPASARSDAGESSASSARSSARALSEGATPRSATLLGPDYDLPLRKHSFAASLASNSPRFARADEAGCGPSVHAYAAATPTHGQAPATFSKARTGRGLLAPLSGGSYAAPDADLPLRRGQVSCTFGSAPRPDGAFHLTRSGLAVAPSAPRLAPPPGSAPRPTSMYLRRNGANSTKAGPTLRPVTALPPLPMIAAAA